MSATPPEISRRQFTKLAAAGSVALLASRPRKVEANSETLKVGLLGCGGRGTGAVQNILMADPNVRVIAMADLFPDRIERSKKMLSRAGFGDRVEIDPDHEFTGLDAYKEILATDIDILIEGSLPYARPMHVEAAVEAGKHIFSEKPAAVDPVGVRRYMAAADKAKQKGLSFVAGTQRRHQKEYVETIARIHDGAIGDIVSARAYWCDRLPFVRERRKEWDTDLEYRIRNWYSYCWISGDNIVEQHVHNLDVINWAKNARPISVVASGGRSWKPDEERFGDIYDHFSCDYEYADGSHMTSMSRHWAGHVAVFEELVGTKGRSNAADLGTPGTDPYVQEHIDLIASIRGTGTYLNEGQHVAESTLTAIMGRMSAYTGMPVTWDEALNSELSLVPDALSFAADYPVSDVPVPGAHRL